MTYSGVGVVVVVVVVTTVTWGSRRPVADMLPELTAFMPETLLSPATTFVARLPPLMLPVRAEDTPAEELDGTVIAYATTTEPSDKVTCTFAATVLAADAMLSWQLLSKAALSAWSPLRAAKSTLVIVRDDAITLAAGRQMHGRSLVQFPPATKFQ
jgi:hypothetical protein